MYMELTHTLLMTCISFVVQRSRSNLGFLHIYISVTHFYNLSTYNDHNLTLFKNTYAYTWCPLTEDAQTLLIWSFKVKGQALKFVYNRFLIWNWSSMMILHTNLETLRKEIHWFGAARSEVNVKLGSFFLIGVYNVTFKVNLSICR